MEHTCRGATFLYKWSVSRNDRADVGNNRGSERINHKAGLDVVPMLFLCGAMMDWTSGVLRFLPNKGEQLFLAAWFPRTWREFFTQP